MVFIERAWEFIGGFGYYNFIFRCKDYCGVFLCYLEFERVVYRE